MLSALALIGWSREISVKTHRCALISSESDEHFSNRFALCITDRTQSVAKYCTADSCKYDA